MSNKDKDDTQQQLMLQLADMNLFAKDETHNIHAIHQKIQRDIEKNEALLDIHCDEISRNIDVLNLPKEVHLFDVVGENERNHDSAKFNAMNDLLLFKSKRSDQSADSTMIHPNKPKAPRMASCLPRFNINVGGKPLKRAPIDPQKKSKLLAQLKSIDTAHGGLWNRLYFNGNQTTNLNCLKIFYLISLSTLILFVNIWSYS